MFIEFVFFLLLLLGHAVAHLIEAEISKPEGRRFDSQ
jgi:hypothetical protein